MILKLRKISFVIDLLKKENDTAMGLSPRRFLPAGLQ